MSPQTPLFYSEIGSITGISFTLGSTAVFFPCNQPTVYLANAEHVHVTARVPHLLSAHLRETIIEPRLKALQGGGA